MKETVRGGLEINNLIDGIDFKNVSLTMLLMFYGRVIESRSADPIITDLKAEIIAAQISPLLLKSDSATLRRLGQLKISKTLAVHAAIRARQYDTFTLEFMKQNPNCTVVNLGCGLDTRFWRIDNGKIHFYDLDLPEVISFRKRYLEENARYKMLGCSVFDRNWIETVIDHQQPVMLLAEGLFMYLPHQELKDLLIYLAEKIKYGQLVAEVVKESYTRGLNKWLVEFKFKHELKFDRPVSYQSGLIDSDDLEKWSPHLHLVDDWSYFDSDSKKLGFVRFLKMYRKVQWTVRYRIGNRQ